MLFQNIISGGFLPNQLSGNLFYSDGQDSTKFTDVGSGVISEIIDKTTTAKCIQATGTKRGVRTANVINGKYGISFDGVDDFYTGPSIVTSAYTKWITFRVTGFETGGATNIYNLISSNTSAGHSFSFFLQGTSMRIRDAFAGNMALDIDMHNANGVMTLIRTVENGSQKLYINGQLSSSQSSAYTNAVPGFNLGSFNNGAANTFFRGYIGDFGLYNRALTANEVALLDTHQKIKYRTLSTNPIKVLVIGQSNGKGTATVKSDDNSSSFIGLDYISSLRHYRDLKDSTGDSYSLSASGSFHPPFVNKLNSLSGRQVLCVNGCKTSTSINSVASGGDNTAQWGSDGTLRGTALLRCNEMLSQAGGGNLDWCIINQGEKDNSYMASNPSWTKAGYKAAYLDLINYIKSNFSGVKILIVQTVQGRQTGTDAALNTTEWNNIIQAQQELSASESNVYIIQDTSTFTITNGNLESIDGIHYTKAGNLIIGNAAGIMINNHL